MNGAWTRAWLVSLLLTVPSAALAQATSSSDDSEAKKEETAPAAASDSATAPEAAPAEEDEAAKKKAQEKKDEPAPAAASTSAPAPGAAADAAKPGDDKKQPDATRNVAALGAAALALGGAAKPWRIVATFEQTLGAGTFVSEPSARQPAYGYSLSVLGTYAIGKLGDGRALAFTRVSFDQQLTNTFVASGTRPREFFFRDIQLGVTAPGFVNLKDFGALIGGSTSIFLPVSKPAVAADRVLRWQIGPSILKNFENVGPGSLTLQLSEGFRKDFGPRVPTISSTEVLCRTPTDDCLGSFANLNFALLHTISANYGVGDWSFNLFWQVSNNFFHSLDDSELPPGFQQEVGRSPNATASFDHRMLSFSAVSVNYTVNDNWFLTAGVSSFGPMLVQRGNNPNGIRFPFFDLDSTASNISSYFFDVNFTY
jgi:hypothetical protein